MIPLISVLSIHRSISCRIISRAFYFTFREPKEIVRKRACKKRRKKNATFQIVTIPYNFS